MEEYKYGEIEMINVEDLVEDCKCLSGESGSPHAIRQVIQRAVDDPSGLIAGLGEPQKAGIKRLYVSDALTILNIAWGPHLRFPPHNHNMWAVIGIYGGREDNTFYRAVEGGLIGCGQKELEVGDTVLLGPSAIHEVVNPLDKLTAAIHIYGGDFFAKERSEWDPETHVELPFDLEANLARFEESNCKWEEMHFTSPS